MYAVIFRAQINQLDDTYTELASRMRLLAIEKYGCTAFTAVTQGNQEIAISYWEKEEHIQAWKQDAQHLVAQQYGRDKWYQTYTVQVTKVIREYTHPT